MWKYTEVNQWNTISLHDCRSDSIHIDGNDLIVDFPDGFWILPQNQHSSYSLAVKTGPSQLCFKDYAMDAVRLYKTTRLFRCPILCRRICIEPDQLLEKVNDGKHELEFLWEFQGGTPRLYQCWLWRNNRGLEAECQFEITASAIEYQWNEILPDRVW